MTARALFRRSSLALLLWICLATVSPAALAAPYSGGTAPTTASSSGGVSPSSAASSSGGVSPSSAASSSGGASPSSAASSSGGVSPSSAASSSGGVSPSSAAQGAFGGLPQSSAPTPTQTQPVAPVVTTSSSAGGSLSGTDTLLIAVGAILVLGAIAYFIWSDSRHQVRLLRRAVPASAADGSPGRGSKARAKSRKLKPAERRRRKRGRAR